MGHSDVAAYAMPLSEQVHNLGKEFFDKKSDKLEMANKSFLTQ